MPNPISGESVEEALATLTALHPKKIDLDLDRILRVLKKLGNPQLRLPPTVHVAGTNGKGSTVAYLRAFAEAAGLKAHVYTCLLYTSPSPRDATLSRMPSSA